MEYLPAASTPMSPPIKSVEKFLLAKSARFAPTEFRPKPRNGSARDGLHMRSGAKPEARVRRMALAPQRTNCCSTRLQAPAPRKAAPIATPEDPILAIVSTTANKPNFRSREIRALTTESAPLNGRMPESVTITGASSGDDKRALSGRAAPETTAARTKDCARDIQKTVDSS